MTFQGGFLSLESQVCMNYRALSPVGNDIQQMEADFHPNTLPLSCSALRSRYKFRDTSPCLIVNVNHVVFCNLHFQPLYSDTIHLGNCKFRGWTTRQWHQQKAVVVPVSGAVLQLKSCFVFLLIIKLSWFKCRFCFSELKTTIVKAVEVDIQCATQPVGTRNSKEISAPWGLLFMRQTAH